MAPLPTELCFWAVIWIQDSSTGHFRWYLHRAKAVFYEYILCWEVLANVLLLRRAAASAFCESRLHLAIGTFQTDRERLAIQIQDQNLHWNLKKFECHGESIKKILFNVPSISSFSNSSSLLSMISWILSWFRLTFSVLFHVEKERPRIHLRTRQKLSNPSRKTVKIPMAAVEFSSEMRAEIASIRTPSSCWIFSSRDLEKIQAKSNLNMLSIHRSILLLYTGQISN